MRTQALVPILAVQKWSEDFRRWVGEKMGVHVEPPAERVERVQRALRVDMPPLRQRPDEPRQGHGIRM